MQGSLAIHKLATLNAVVFGMIAAVAIVLSDGSKPSGWLISASVIAGLVNLCVAIWWEE